MDSTIGRDEAAVSSLDMGIGFVISIP